MFDEELAAVKHLIRENQYDAARALLETIDDPRARRWLHQLDQATLTHYRSARFNPILAEAESCYLDAKKCQGRERRQSACDLLFVMILALSFTAILTFALALHLMVTLPSTGVLAGLLFMLSGVVGLTSVAILRRYH